MHTHYDVHTEPALRRWIVSFRRAGFRGLPKRQGKVPTSERFMESSRRVSPRLHGVALAGEFTLQGASLIRQPRKYQESDQDRQEARQLVPLCGGGWVLASVTADTGSPTGTASTHTLPLSSAIS